MLDLDEMQFEILRSESSAAGVGFGIGLDVSVNDGGFDPGEFGWLTQDSVNPTRGVTMFGKDVATGRTWSWQLHTDKDDTQEALAALGTLAAAWRARQVAGTPGRVLPLRYRIGDRVRRVYGRPRRFSAPPSNLIMSGLIPITADFSVVDDLHYADDESSTVITYSQDNDGGFVLPTTLPIVTLPGSNRQGLVTVQGDAPTYPIIRIEGPITNPYVASEDWTLNLNMTIPEGDYVEIDTRPWRLTATRNGNPRDSVAGKLGRRQWLSDVTLQPGNYELVFGGSSSTGGATCAVSWRDAWTSL